MTSLLASADANAVPADLFTDEAVADPYTHDGALREAAPVTWLDAHQCYFVGRQELVQPILANWKTYSSLSKPFDQSSSAIPQVLVTDDPPGHTLVRNALMQFMSPVALKSAFDEFVAVAESQVDALLSRDVVDGHDIAATFVLKVFPDYLGLPEQGRQHLLSFGEAIFNSVGPNNQRTQESMARAVPAFEWITTQCNADVVTPGKLADKVYSLPEAGVVSHDQAGLLVRALFSAGFDTTVLSLTAVFYWLGQNPAQWSHLQDPKLFKRAFEETLRIEPPARLLARVAKEDVELAGVSLKAGDHVVLSLAAAGRDPRKWDQPDRFDILRRPGRHMSFGAGIHTCIGQVLSRLEFEALFSVLARKVKAIEPAGDPVRLMNNIANGWSSVPLRIVPA